MTQKTDCKTFRDHFPEFANKITYDDNAINFWGLIAGKLIREVIWGDMTCLGIELFIAHQMVLEKMAAEAAKRGGNPGTQVGVLTSKSVGSVSAGYEIMAATIKDAGHWNLTTYGTRFYALMRIQGAVPIQVGAGGPMTDSVGGAWAGPPTIFTHQVP